jgi:hypothetical protein
MSGHTLMAVLQHASFLQHWIDAIGGVIVPSALYRVGDRVLAVPHHQGAGGARWS